MSGSIHLLPHHFLPEITLSFQTDFQNFSGELTLLSKGNNLFVDYVHEFYTICLFSEPPSSSITNSNFMTDVNNQTALWIEGEFVSSGSALSYTPT